jgi:hypothetical protein
VVYCRLRRADGEGGGVVDASRVDDRVGERPAAGIGNSDLQFCRVGDG